MYHTIDGHTFAITQHLQQQLKAQGISCTIKPANQVCAADIQACSVCVLGASVRYGKHHKAVYQCIAQHSALLQSKPSVFFSVNAVARKTGKNTAYGNTYVRKFLQEITWQPHHVAVFAGKINYPAYNWLEKNIIRCIMRLTGGPTNTQASFELTNWQAVDALAQHIATMAVVDTQH